MRTTYCPNCASDNVEFKADVLVGCCEHKSGEMWHCNACEEEFTIQVVYSDEKAEVDCPHDSGAACGGGCHGCDHKK